MRRFFRALAARTFLLNIALLPYHLFLSGISACLLLGFLYDAVTALFLVFLACLASFADFHLCTPALLFQRLVVWLVSLTLPETRVLLRVFPETLTPVEARFYETTKAVYYLETHGGADFLHFLAFLVLQARLPCHSGRSQVFVTHDLAWRLPFTGIFAALMGIHVSMLKANVVWDHLALDNRDVFVSGSPTHHATARIDELRSIAAVAFAHKAFLAPVHTYGENLPQQSVTPEYFYQWLKRCTCACEPSGPPVLVVACAPIAASPTHTNSHQVQVIGNAILQAYERSLYVSAIQAFHGIPVDVFEHHPNSSTLSRR
jgi:hypothetical protein